MTENTQMNYRTQVLDAARVFWQQHTKSDALSMTMAELHTDVELVIRAARGAAQAAPSNGALAAPAQPVTWPRNAAEVREFMDAHCQREERANDDSSPSDDDLYALTAHDFLSAVNWWADSPHHPGATQPAAQEGDTA